MWTDNLHRLSDQLDSTLSLRIYECPHPYKRLLSLDELVHCAGTGRFRFLKDTCCDIATIRKREQALCGSPMRLYNANAATLLESMRTEAAGFSGVMANFHPELYVWLVQSWQREPEKAEMLLVLQQPKIWRIQHDAGSGIHGPRHADAYSLKPLETADGAAHLLHAGNDVRKDGFKGSVLCKAEIGAGDALTLDVHGAECAVHAGDVYAHETEDAVPDVQHDVLRPTVALPDVRFEEIPASSNLSTMMVIAARVNPIVRATSARETGSRRTRSMISSMLPIFMEAALRVGFFRSAFLRDNPCGGIGKAWRDMRGLPRIPMVGVLLQRLLPTFCRHEYYVNTCVCAGEHVRPAVSDNITCMPAKSVTLHSQVQHIGAGLSAPTSVSGLMRAKEYVAKAIGK